MTEGFDNTILSDEEAEKLARGSEDIDPGPEDDAEGVAADATDEEDSSDAADTTVSDQEDSDPAPK